MGRIEESEALARELPAAPALAGKIELAST
jgi:hypothetical protein